MHEGHRKRMYEKLKTDAGICDHELLEILLYNALPRKNTNPIAHKLIEAFGSLAGVFEADVEQLTEIDGVGENVALFIKCVAECNKRTKTQSAGVAVLKNYDEFKKFVVARMRGNSKEVLEIYFLTKGGKVKRVSSFTDEERGKVEVDSNKITAIIAKEKPYGLLVAHNHLSGNAAPSVSDDRFTGELQLMCSMNNVVLYDHCIYASDNNIYSYFESGKIEAIREEFSFKRVIDRQIEAATDQNKK
ncbi:MAG: hypothetical protein K2I29_03550 [Clostridia bacterium]|nr:hypothetical protein [Clostridia bacterium]